MEDHTSHSGKSGVHAGMKTKGHYRGLGIEMALHFVIMYLVMYAMIATLAHFYLNIGNVWMTLMMVTPMAPIMLWSMPSMFPSRTMNFLIIGIATVVFLVGLYGMRAQAGVGDAQFLRSMIPHHSGAILMCEQASLTDPEILALCRDIMDSQSKEIEQMQTILERLK